jgi:hypothetical protein
MKIVSLNRELTLDAHNLAFNVDEELTQELMDLVVYGYLTFTLAGNGKILKVSIPADKEAGFSKQNVVSLEEKLNEAAETIQRPKVRHQRMLERMAAEMGLSLD